MTITRRRKWKHVTLQRHARSPTALKAHVSQFFCCFHTVFSSFSFQTKFDFLPAETSLLGLSESEACLVSSNNEKSTGTFCCKMTEEPPPMTSKRFSSYEVKLNPRVRNWVKQKLELLCGSCLRSQRAGEHVWLPAVPFRSCACRGGNVVLGWLFGFEPNTLKLWCERSISTLTCVILCSVIRK